jgi:hypothetical protein
MEIYKKMAEASRKIGAVGKDAKNKQQGWEYRSIEAIYNGVHDALSESGIFITPKILQIIKEKETISKSGTAGFYYLLEVEFTFYAEDGSNVKAVTWGESNDTSDKCINKCMTAAYKYCLMQTFTIPFKDVLVDGDSEVQEIYLSQPHGQKPHNQKGNTAQANKSTAKPQEEAVKPKSIEQTFNSAIKLFQSEFGISIEELEHHFGHPLDHDYITQDLISKLRELVKYLREGNKLTFPDKKLVEEETFQTYQDEF